MPFRAAWPSCKPLVSCASQSCTMPSIGKSVGGAGGRGDGRNESGRRREWGADQVGGGQIKAENWVISVVGVLLIPYPLTCLPWSIRTCAGYIASTHQNSPIQATRAYHQAREQMPPYPESSSCAKGKLPSPLFRCCYESVLMCVKLGMIPMSAEQPAERGIFPSEG